MNASKSSSKASVQVTLVRSVHGRLRAHKACVRGLGLRRIGHTVEVVDTVENRGMISKVSYLLKVDGGVSDAS
ncbi:MAG: 50S ribosomal protein L30 [Candidatus Porifericomitaceae bacterium WSBS_2022_MAG_OTU9]